MECRLAQGTRVRNASGDVASTVHESPASWDVAQTADGFVTYAVKLPDAAQSPATKIRFRQVRDLVSGKAASWALDDVAGGLLRASTRPTFNVLLLLNASSVSMSIHPDGY